MKVLVLVIVSFDKPEYHDMLAVWRERARDDVWFIQCKSDKEWIGDVVNDIGEPLRSSLKNPPFLADSHSLGSASLKHRFELDRENRTVFVRADECLIPGILHKTVEALSFFLHHWTFTNGKEGSNSRQAVSKAAPLGNVVLLEGQQNFSPDILVNPVHDT